LSTHGRLPIRLQERKLTESRESLEDPGRDIVAGTEAARASDSLLATQHVLEMFRRALPNGASRRHLDRLSNRLTKILSEARKLTTP
jgi:hypothetical protein